MVRMKEKWRSKCETKWVIMGAVNKYGQWKENVVNSGTENVKNES